ncbi:MAG: threonine/serine exporter family protein [Turicibacter sanguinis]
MKENVILIISATIESLGFALLFRVRKDRLIYGTIGGMVTITIYLWLFSIHQDAFLSNLIAGIFATAYSEIFARVLKSPAIVFLVPSVIPLVPGGSLYYAMRAFILNDEPGFQVIFIIHLVQNRDSRFDYISIHFLLLFKIVKKKV